MKTLSSIRIGRKKVTFNKSINALDRLGYFVMVDNAMTYASRNQKEVFVNFLNKINTLRENVK